MSLPKELTTVTRFSKIMAITLFITLPILAFVFGMNYQKLLINTNQLENQPVNQTETACTLDAKICPDGSTVGRTGPNCKFAPCPRTKKTPPPEDQITGLQLY